LIVKEIFNNILLFWQNPKSYYALSFVIMKIAEESFLRLLSKSQSPKISFIKSFKELFIFQTLPFYNSEFLEELFFSPHFVK